MVVWDPVADARAELQGVPLSSWLPDDLRSAFFELLERAQESLSVASGRLAGDVIVEAGDAGGSLYVLTRGFVRTLFQSGGRETSVVPMNVGRLFGLVEAGVLGETTSRFADSVSVARTGRGEGDTTRVLQVGSAAVDLLRQHDRLGEVLRAEAVKQLLMVGQTARLRQIGKAELILAHVIAHAWFGEDVEIDERRRYQNVPLSRSKTLTEADAELYTGFTANSLRRARKRLMDRGLITTMREVGHSCTIMVTNPDALLKAAEQGQLPERRVKTWEPVKNGRRAEDRAYFRELAKRPIDPPDPASLS